MGGLIPTFLKDHFLKIKHAKKSSKTFRDHREIFLNIYNNHKWGSLNSGPGSSLESTTNIRSFIDRIFTDYAIHSLLDIPCGDFFWMRHVDIPKHIKYSGADIIPELVHNNQKFNEHNISFKILDITSDRLERFDLVLVRDCWVHFSYQDILQSIENIINSGSTFLLTTTFKKLSVNYDIHTGSWRPINLDLKPFKFPAPIAIQEENYPAKYKSAFRGKSLALYSIEEIKATINS